MCPPVVYMLNTVKMEPDPSKKLLDILHGSTVSLRMVPGSDPTTPRAFGTSCEMSGEWPGVRLSDR